MFALHGRAHLRNNLLFHDSRPVHLCNNRKQMMIKTQIPTRRLRPAVDFLCAPSALCRLRRAQTERHFKKCREVSFVQLGRLSVQAGQMWMYIQPVCTIPFDQDSPSVVNDTEIRDESDLWHTFTVSQAVSQKCVTIMTQFKKRTHADSKPLDNTHRGSSNVSQLCDKVCHKFEKCHKLCHKSVSRNCVTIITQS